MQRARAPSKTEPCITAPTSFAPHQHAPSLGAINRPRSLPSSAPTNSGNLLRARSQPTPWPAQTRVQVVLVTALIHFRGQSDPPQAGRTLIFTICPANSFIITFQTLEARRAPLCVISLSGSLGNEAPHPLCFHPARHASIPVNPPLPDQPAIKTLSKTSSLYPDSTRQGSTAPRPLCIIFLFPQCRLTSPCLTLA